MPAGPPSTPRFKRWFKGSVAVERDGSPSTFFHGSREPDIREFKNQRTAYGFFFTPDEDTALFYGPYLYRVHLRIRRLADLGDDGPGPTFLKVARATFGGFHGPELHRYDEGWSQWETMTEKGLHQWFAEYVLTSDEPAVQRWLARYRKKATADGGQADELATDSGLAESFDYDALDVEATVRGLVRRAPGLRADFRHEFRLEHEAVISAENAYGSQDFYMKHQDDMIQTAESMGYDGVRFADPSSTGVSESWVAFRAEQVWIVAVEHHPEVRR